MLLSSGDDETTQQPPEVYQSTQMEGDARHGSRIVNWIKKISKCANSSAENDAEVVENSNKMIVRI